MYYVFLDIDGVFTSARVHVAHNGAYPIWAKFDSTAVDFMNYIHDAYEVKFVLMSSWGNGINVSGMIGHWIESTFASAGFRGEFARELKVDPNNILRDDYSKRRGDYVKNYLDNYAVDYEDFILFDDETHNFDDVLDDKRLVQTDPENGLLLKHMNKAKSIMGEWKKK